MLRIHSRTSIRVRSKLFRKKRSALLLSVTLNSTAIKCSHPRRRPIRNTSRSRFWSSPRCLLRSWLCSRLGSQEISQKWLVKEICSGSQLGSAHSSINRIQIQVLRPLVSRKKLWDRRQICISRNQSSYRHLTTSLPAKCKLLKRQMRNSQMSNVTRQRVPSQLRQH